MHKKVFSVTVALIIGAGTSVRASEFTALSLNTAEDDASVPASDDGAKYRNHEFSLEGYGFLTLNEYSVEHLTGERLRHNGSLGLGAGGEYFFCRYVGVEAEGFSETTHHAIVDDVGGNLVLRLPLGESGFAPYVFGGGGHRFAPENGTYADAGAGIEYRFTPHLGAFTDARWVCTDWIHDYALGRLGFRVAF